LKGICGGEQKLKGKGIDIGKRDLSPSSFSISISLVSEN